MTGIFLTNIFNHYQKPFYDALNKKIDGICYFLQTEKLSDERVSLGFKEYELPSYVLDASALSFEETMAKYGKLIEDCDFAIIGGISVRYIKNRIRKKKLTIDMDERWSKQYPKGLLHIKKILSVYKHHTRFQNGMLFDLGISAYFAADMKRYFASVNRTYNWAYFPESVNEEYVIKNRRESEKVIIVWVARFIDWKHPETVIKLAENLKQEKLPFLIKMIGNGQLLDEYKNVVYEKNLNDVVELTGSIGVDEVRREMDQADIFVATSDFNEGWGVVVNEAMNSCCAVVASHAEGSVPMLINDGINGYIYENGNDIDLFRKVKELIENPKLRDIFGKRAFDTIKNEWNAEVAADRFILFLDDIQKNGVCDRFSSGPCSKARVLQNNWFS